MGSGNKRVGGHNTTVGVLRGEVPNEACANGRLFHAVKQKPPGEHRTKTESYVYSDRRLAARFCAKGPHGDVGANDAAPTSQLQSLRVLLSTISYGGGGDFRVVGRACAFIKSKHRDSNIRRAAFNFGGGEFG